ncbi:MAG TPA: AbrB/MazE/SpoVT family DNA-binding domain-containing protein [Devosia sp.]|nr:AbrB/MazE/SpoVT family DNA-binding domain-containing protein [Devosia sp.]
MQVSRWGNSLAVRLPAELVETLGLKEGDEVDLRIDADNTHSLAVVRQLSRADALRNLQKFRGMMPAGYKFNREEANER